MFHCNLEGENILTKSILEQVGERLRDRREYKGYSAAEVSRYCGVAPSVILQMEKGIYKPPYGLYESICSTLGITTADLFGCFRWIYVTPTEGERGHDRTH